jgi:hypothetical protein
MSEEHSSVLTKKSDVGNKVRSGSGGAKSDGPVAIALKYSLKIGKEATDNIKVGTWLESPTNPSAMVVDIRNDFQKLNDALGKAQFEFKQVKRGYEGDLATKLSDLDKAVEELAGRKVANTTVERQTMLDDIEKHTATCKQISGEIAEAIRVGNLAKPVLTVGGAIRVIAGTPITLKQLGASIKPSLPLKIMEGSQELGPTGFMTAGKHTVRVVSERNETHDFAERTVEVEAYLIKPVITVASESVTVTVRKPITAAVLGATVSDNQTLKILQGQKELDPEGFATPGERTLTLVCEPPPPNERAQRQIKLKVTNQKREISFSNPKPVTWGTPVTRELLKATATGEGGSAEVVPPSGDLVIGANIYTLRAPGLKKEWWDDAVESTATVTFHRIPREITWTLPKSLPGNTIVTPETLKAELWEKPGKDRIKSEDELTVSAPTDGHLAVGKKVTITVSIEEEDYHEAATINGTIEVTKSKPTLNWKKPAPAALDKDGNLKLGPNQLNATIIPASFADDPDYAPAEGHIIKTEGVHRLDAKLVATADSDEAVASVVLAVAKNATALRGMNEMNSGEAFKKPEKPTAKAPGDGTYERWEEWQTSDPSDPNATGTQGKRMLTEISLLKPAELTAYLKKIKEEDDKLPVENRKVSHWTDQPGKKHIAFKNGLEVRFKPNGDKHTGGKPCFCLEVRKDPTEALAGGQDKIAFKVTAHGKPAAKGPSQLEYPSNFMKEAQLDYKDGAMAATHLRLL